MVSARLALHYLLGRVWRARPLGVDGNANVTLGSCIVA
jgi:hypothetical protein